MASKRNSIIAVMVLALAAGSARATILTVEGTGTNITMTNFGSNVSANGTGFNVSNGATPNVALTWVDSGGGVFWEFYNDGEWSAAQLQGFTSSGSSNHDILFTPDTGYGVIVNSFVFDDYIGWFGGNSFTWTLFQDDASGTVIATGTETTSDGQDLPVSTGMATAYTGPVLLRITAEPDPDTATDDDQALDDINFNQVAVAAQQPMPTNGADNVPTNQVLSWSAPDDITPTGYDVYLDPNQTKVANSDVSALQSANQPGTSFDPGGLVNETTYYWKVNTIDPNNGGNPFIRPGAVWSFTTAPAIPVITIHPQSQTIPAGDTAVFTVAGLNNPDFQWKRDGVPLVNGGNISGADTETLTINNAQVGEEGGYSCELSNGAGMVETNAARLLTRRLMGWWKLDNDLTDSVGSVVSGAPAHDGSTTRPDPNFVAGLVNQGYRFFAADPNTIVIDDSDYFNFHRRGMTVGVWVNSNTTSWGGVVSKHTRFSDGWTLDLDGSGFFGAPAAAFVVRGSHGDLPGTSDNNDVADNEWHLFTAVIDPATNTSRLYVDGKFRNETGTYDVSVATESPNPLTFGAEMPDGQIPYDGLIDEVKIWSYALSDLQIAQEYLAVIDTSLCIGDPVNHQNPQFDFNGDCITNVVDFGIFTGGWLECYLVPDCLN